MVFEDLPSAPRSYETAMKHRQAIARLLHQRGGLSTVKEPVVLAHLVGSDLRLAAAMLSKPLLPCEQRFPRTSHSVRISQEADRRMQALMAKLPESSNTTVMRDVFYHLQVLGLAYDTEYCRDVKAENALNPLYHALHHLYDVLGELREARRDREDTFDPDYAILLTAAMFAWSCVPDKFPERFHSPLVFNIIVGHLIELKKCLWGTANPCESWTRAGADLDVLLWTARLSISLAAKPYKYTKLGRLPEPDTAWILGLFKQITLRLEVKTWTVLESRLANFPTRGYCSSTDPNLNT